MKNNKTILREFYRVSEIDGETTEKQTSMFEPHSRARLTKEEVHMRDENGTIFLVGVIQRADAKNKNGRIYPRTILEREYDLYMKLVKENRAVGELDHSDELEVSLQSACILMRDMWWQDNNLMGKAQVLTTTKGRELSAMIRDGVVPGISSRGLGSTRTVGGEQIVESDFSLICFDIVADPSTHGAFMTQNKIVGEGKNYRFSKAARVNRALSGILND